MAQNYTVSSRFLDVGKEPKIDLGPIEEYEKKPLVSLEEAVVRIEKSLFNLDPRVKTALRNSREPADGLPPNESAAIHLYTMEWPDPHPSLYTVFNQHLRSQERKSLTPWFLYLKLFLTALYKLPSFKGVIWRGVPQNLSDQYKDDCIWWGVSSCSKSRHVTTNFIGSASERTLFMVECKNGKAINAHSHHPEEDEVILMPGTFLRVMNKSNPVAGLHLVHLQEAPPPYQIIAPPFDVPAPPPNLTSSAEDDEVHRRALAEWKQIHGENLLSKISKTNFLEAVKFL